MEMYFVKTDLPTQQAGAQTPPRIQTAHGNGERPQNSREPPRQGSQKTVGIRRLMCAAVNALKVSADFQRVSRLGQKCSFPSFIMLALRREDKDTPFRLGLTVSRKVGNAVVRNRAKRRLREVVRLSAPVEKLRGVDIVLISKASASERDFSLMQKDFLQGLEKLGIAP